MTHNTLHKWGWGFRLMRVHGQSMAPSLKDGALVVIDEGAVARRPLRRGDLVAARPPSLAGRALVKRLAGLPHERVEIDGCLWQLGPDHYFLLGDRGEDSLDSRRFGPVSHQALLGRVLTKKVAFPALSKTS